MPSGGSPPEPGGRKWAALNQYSVSMLQFVVFIVDNGNNRTYFFWNAINMHMKRGIN